MSEQRGLRKTRVGTVVSDKMDKTIVVEIKERVRHPLYGKIMPAYVKESAAPPICRVFACTVA